MLIFECSLKQSCIMSKPEALRLKYREPDICLVSADCSCIIADSMLENIDDGGTWYWED